MNIETLRTYCLNKKGVTESFPFGDNTIVFKIFDKIFLLAGLDKPINFNVKCNPEEAVTLREDHQEIIPGYHMNKKHWNTVFYNGTLSDVFLHQLIDHSYQLVLESLTKTKQKEIKNS
jgi:predicted DNA-binding protein (MmcQ/YjbR family)